MSKLRFRYVDAEIEGMEPGAVVDAIRVALAGQEIRAVEETPNGVHASVELRPSAPVAALAASNEPAHVERPKPPRATGAKPRAKAKRQAAAPSLSAAEASGDSGCAAACLQSLAKGPLTSMEIIKRAGYSEGGVYMALKTLRTQGRIEMIDDDGVRKNRLVPVKA